VDSPLSGGHFFAKPNRKTIRHRLKFELRVLFLRRVHNLCLSFELACVQRFSKKPPEREGSKNTPRRERSTRCKDTLRLFYTLSRFCRIALGIDLLTGISFSQSWLATRPETLHSLPNHFLPQVALKREKSTVNILSKEKIYFCGKCQWFL
jgi:hypothetical protein